MTYNEFYNNIARSHHADNRDLETYCCKKLTL